MSWPCRNFKAFNTGSMESSGVVTKTTLEASTVFCVSSSGLELLTLSDSFTADANVRLATETTSYPDLSKATASAVPTFPAPITPIGEFLLKYVNFNLPNQEFQLLLSHFLQPSL